jgi:hypothetical protein
MAAPVALLAAREAWRPGLLRVSILGQLILSTALAWENSQFWDGYRQFVYSVSPQIREKRTWINGEWGLRFYAEEAGALPLRRGQPLRPGDLVLSSQLAYPIPFTTGGGQLVPVSEWSIRPVLPLRLFGLRARSAYSTDTAGLRAFDWSSAPVDRVTASLVVSRRPVLEYLPMNASEADQQIVSGLYELESGQWRWMSERASILLKPPTEPRMIRAEVFIPDSSPARRVTLEVDGKTVGDQVFDRPGKYEVQSASPVAGSGDSSNLTISVDKTFSVPGDHRKLGVIVMGAGWQ